MVIPATNWIAHFCENPQLHAEPKIIIVWREIYPNLGCITTKFFLVKLSI